MKTKLILIACVITFTFFIFTEDKEELFSANSNQEREDKLVLPSPSHQAIAEQGKITHQSYNPGSDESFLTDEEALTPEDADDEDGAESISAEELDIISSEDELQQD